MAIAVNDLEAAIAWYAEVFGATVDHREQVESDGVEEALLKVADSYVQLLTPIDDTSPVAKYLATKGEGLHHIGYRVDDCGVALQAVKDAGGRVIDEAPRPGLAGDDGGLRAPEDVVRHADRAGAGSPSERRCGAGGATGPAKVQLAEQFLEQFEHPGHLLGSEPARDPAPGRAGTAARSPSRSR